MNETENVTAGTIGSSAVLADARALTKEQIAILEHTRNRAAGGYYCGDSPAMQQLVAAGLMVFAGRKSFVPDDYFQMTGAGREALKSANPTVYTDDTLCKSET